MSSVLHRSFKSTKCKTSLKLAVSRIKLLKNKKDVHLRQLKREVAQLLESGQDQTARIRVEHVIREEKMMAAYDLVEIYCELIVARLAIIEKQKHCPIDLKEAVTSIIFASPRCADIPELMDVRKQLSAKYGKEFVTAAIDLRPECGVSRMLVEKLSAVAPDGPTKVKVLTDIANEHNIKWEPNWFQDKDSKPPEDLLNGPGAETFDRIRVQPTSFRSSPVEHKQGSSAPNIYKAAVSEVKQQEFAPIDAGSTQMPPSIFHAEAGLRGGQNWNMKFKDATAAAYAAAESAERASMAARAAAELSSRAQSTSHSSKEIASSSIFEGDEDNRVYAASTLQGEDLAKDPKHNSIRGRSSRIPDRQRYEQDNTERGRFGEGASTESYDQSREQYNFHSKEGSESDKSSHIRRQSISSISSQSSDIYENLSFSNPSRYDNERRESPLFDEPAGVSNSLSGFGSQSGAFDEKYSLFSNTDSQRHGFSSFEDPALTSYHGNVRKDEWEGSAGSHCLSSYSSGFRDEKDGVFSVSSPHAYSMGTSKGPFVELQHDNLELQHDNNHSETKNLDTRSTAGAVFDDSGSDDDDCMLNTGRKDNGQISGVQSGGNWGTQSNLSSKSLYQPELTESFRKSPLYSQLVEPVPLSFDDSDREDIDREESIKRSEVGQKNDSWGQEASPRKDHGHGQSSDGRNISLFSSESLDKGNQIDSGKLAFTDLSGNLESPRHRKSGSNISAFDGRSSSNWIDSEKDRHSMGSPPSQASTDSRMDSLYDYEHQSNADSVMELNYRPLTGGLRHKKYRLPSYTKDTLLSQEPATDQRDDSDEKFDQSRNEPVSKIAYESPTKLSKPRSPEKYFDDSSEEDVPTQFPIRKGRPVARQSQRTRASFRRAGGSSTSSPRMSYEASSSTKSVPEREDSLPRHHTREALPKNMTSVRTSALREEQADSRPKYSSRMSDVGSYPEPGERSASPPLRNATATSSRSEGSSNASSSAKTLSTEDSMKRASHVHPKLPDYDSLAAHLQSLKANRK